MLNLLIKCFATEFDKNCNEFSSFQQMAADLEYGDRISTIEDLMHQTRSRHDSLPPSYEEATKNSSCSGPTEDRDNILPKYSTVTECPHCATSVLSPSGPRSL